MPCETEGPETNYLYHYQRFDRECDRDSLIYILTNARVRCSNPMRFNDPWDGKPHVRTDDVGERRRTEEMARFFETVARAPSHYAEQRTLRHSPSLTGFIKRVTSKLAEEIDRKYRVYCLSPFPDINLMWSHYAKGHTGVCLQFSKSNPVFATAQKIIYTEKLPYYRIDGGPDEAQFMLLTKSDEWKYKSEYRIIALAGEALGERAGLLVTRKDYLQIEKQWLVSVIAGCRSPLDEIRELVSKYSPGLPIKRAAMAPDAYRVTVEDL